MKQTFIQVNLPVSILREGARFIAYTPALDISTSGRNYEEVKKRFNELVEIFFEEITKKGTLKDVLHELGWEKIHMRWMPPVVVSQELETIRVPALV